MRKFFITKPLRWLKYSAITALACCLFSIQTYAQSPVETHGQLKVSGSHVVNKNGQTFSLAGNSFFWTNNGWGGERFYKKEAVNFLQWNWKSSIVRAAMGVQENGGYLSDKAGNKARVKAVVDAAIEYGIYVIIDWHSHHAEDNRQEAIDFFKEMAQTYGDNPNVIYEIYNEPLNTTSWSNTIKPYANAVINAIRQYDPDNLIIVGTPTWSQDVDVASLDPINKSNIAYTVHFYAATHKQFLRDKCTTAMNNGIALFCTEWGTCNNLGEGFVDEAETDIWMAFLKENGISHCNWSINDKDESASVLKSGASSNGGWSSSNLTQSGQKVYDIISNWNSSGSGGSNTGSNSIVVRARGVKGTEKITLRVGGTAIKTWTLSTSYRSLSASTNRTGVIKVHYTNDASGRDARINYIKVNGQTRQAENQSNNTAVYQNGSCGGSNSEWMHCNGFINFGKVSTSSTPSNFSKKIEAESYTYMSGVKTQACSEGTLNVGWLNSGDWMTYTDIDIPSSGTYTIEYRVSSPYSTGNIRLEQNSGTKLLGQKNVPKTNGWQNWTTISHTVTLNAGKQDIAIGIGSGRFNINWFRITSGYKSAGDETKQLNSTQKLTIYPNPVNDQLNLQLNEQQLFSNLRIIDLTGKVILEKQVENQAEQIDVSTLPKGMYYIQVNNEQAKFIKY